MESDKETLAVKKHQEAEVYLREGKLDEAIAACSLALEALSDFAPACKTLGDIMLGTGQLESARDWYEKALVTQPDWAKVHANLGSIYANQQEWQLAISCYQKAISLKPDFAGFYRNLAKVWKFAGKADLARDFSERAEVLEKKPRTVSESLSLAKSLVEEGKLSEAIACYRQVIELNPSGFEAYYLLGDALVGTGNFDEATGSYKKALEIQPNNLILQQKLGKALLEKGDFYEAVLAFKQAIEINPNYIWSYQKLGDSLMKLKNWDAAINAYRKALEIDSQKAIVYNNLGLALTENKQFAEAVEAYKSAINLKPNNHSFYYNLGNALSKKGKTGKAISVYEKAIALKPNRAEYYICLADCLRKNQGWDEAIACYSKGIELNPQDSNAYYLLGKILEEQNRWKEAIAIYQQGLERCPQDTKLTLRLQDLLHNPKGSMAYDIAMLFVKEQNWERAILSYQELLKIQPWPEDKVKDYLNLGTVLVKARKLPEVIESYHQVFQKNLQNLEFYYQFSIHLSEAGLIKEAVAFFKERPLVETASLEDETLNIPVSRYDQILHCFNSNNSQELNMDTDLENLQAEAEQIEGHFQEQKLQIVVANKLKNRQKKLLKKLGISWEYLDLINLENDALENIYLNATGEVFNELQQRTKIESHKKLNCWEPINNASEFPHTIAEFQYMYAVDPMTGKVLRTNESFYVQDLAIIYRFVGREVFYILTGSFESGKLCLYIPKFALVISWSDRKSKNKNSLKFLKKFNAFLVTYARDVREYLKSDRPRLLTSIVGFRKNLGHFFWQELNGIYYLEKNRILDKVNCFAVADYEPMEIRTVIPELPEAKILRMPGLSSAERFQFLLKNNCFCFRVANHFMTEDYLSRISNVATQKCSKEFLKMLAELREKKETLPLLWLNVRSHNKSWVSQVEGYANIINKLTESFPNLGIVFDGWIDCNEVVENILKLVKTELKVYNTLGCPLHESIVWADRIDAYIGVVGSGLVITSWLSNKPGVAFGDRGHLGQSCFWSKVKENAIAPIFLKPQEINPVEHKMYASYEIEWEVIYEKIFGILKQI